MHSFDIYDVVVVDIPQVTADVGKAHCSEHLHVATDLINMVGFLFTRLEVDDNHLLVVVDDAVGAGFVRIAPVMVEVKNAALVEYFPMWGEPISYLLVFEFGFYVGFQLITRHGVTKRYPIEFELRHRLVNLIIVVDGGKERVKDVPRLDVGLTSLQVVLRASMRFSR